MPCAVDQQQTPAFPPPPVAARALFHAYRNKQWFKSKAQNHVLESINLSVHEGKTLGIVGESGSGKSTLSRLLLGLEVPVSGQVLLRGKPMPKPNTLEWTKLRAQMQMVFQNPYAALDKRMNVLEQVAEPLRIHNMATPYQSLEIARECLAKVSFPVHLLDYRPDKLSGGQLQRVVIARAVVTRPEFLVCDEPVASLDVSVQAQVLQLLEKLKTDIGLTMVFVSHDLNVVSYISDHIAVMHQGRIVEYGPAESVFSAPLHPYSRLLLESAPGSGAPVPKLIKSADSPVFSSGCRFLPRCLRKQAACQCNTPPTLHFLTKDRAVACFYPLDTL